MNLDKSPEIKCNECRRKFEFKPLEFIIGEYQGVYIQCPFCRNKYLSYISDNEIRERITHARILKQKVLSKDIPDSERNILVGEHYEYITRTRELMRHLLKEQNHLIDEI